MTHAESAADGGDDVRDEGFETAGDLEPESTPAPAEPTPYTPPRWALPLLAVLIILLVLANYAGTVLFSGGWAETHPLGLVTFNASNKFLLLTANGVGLLPFLVLPTLRLLAPDPLFYLLGYLYRDRALHWGRRVFPGTGPIFDQIHESDAALHKMLYPLVAIAPNNPICLLAGAARLPWRLFAVLNIAGTILRVLLLRLLAMIFEDQVSAIVDWVSDYQKYLLPVSLALIVPLIIWQFRSDRGLLGHAAHLEEEIEEEIEAEPAGD